MVKVSERAHWCHANDCRKVILSALLMCGRHWAMVPRPIQRLVLKHYKSGQEQGEVQFSAEWNASADAAIAYVSAMERWEHRG